MSQLVIFILQWIWEDNMQFLQDKNIFEHTYFGFMWQMCGYIPTTLPKDEPERVPLMAAKLSASFVLETLIHAKEKVQNLKSTEYMTNENKKKACVKLERIFHLDFPLFLCTFFQKD